MKVTPQQVKEIKKLRQKGKSANEISKLYGINRRHVYYLVDDKYKQLMNRLSKQRSERLRAEGRCTTCGQKKK